MPAPRESLDLAPVLAAVSEVLAGAARPVALHEPHFGGRELEYLAECIRTGWVSSAGAFVDRFEQEIARFTGARHAVLTVNGTSALHVALLAAGVSRDDEVIIPALTFVATANAVRYCGATPHFADSDETTLGIDPAKLGTHLARIAERRAGGCFNRTTGRRIAAVVPMHTFGHPVDMDPLLEVCATHGLPVIEDAAESLGSRYRGRHTGTLGLLGTLSFNGNKVLTTGGGGAVLTDDAELARALRHVTTTAKLAHPWEFRHDRVGYNYRMPNLNAALGCAQLEQLPAFLEAKRALAARYAAAFAGVGGVRFFVEAPGATSNYWLNALLLDPEHAASRDVLIETLHKDRIFVRPAWTPMPSLPMYRECPAMDLGVAESLHARIVNLPSSPHL